MLHRKKFSASLTRSLSARSPSTVPRGLGSSSDMIAGILSPLSLATALNFPWCRGKCHSIAYRGTHGSKKIRGLSLHGARGNPPVPPSTIHFTSLKAGPTGAISAVTSSPPFGTGRRVASGPMSALERIADSSRAACYVRNVPTD